MPRFSLRTVMAFVLVASTVLAAVCVASPPWAGAAASTSFFTLTCSLLGVGFARDGRRIYCTGFATLGWTYMALAYGPGIDAKIGRHLLAPKISRVLYDAIHAEAPTPLPPPPPAGGGFQSVPVGPLAAGVAAGGGFAAPAGPVRPAAADMVRILVAFEALLWAFLGGWAALAFASGEKGPSADAPGGGRGPTDPPAGGPASLSPRG